MKQGRIKLSLLGHFSLSPTELMNWGRMWQIRPTRTNMNYISAYIDGYGRAIEEDCFNLGIKQLKSESNKSTEAKILEIEILEKICDSRHMRYRDMKKIGITVINKTITELYADPANSYISIGDMIIIAVAKIKGENIEGMLQKYRKNSP